MNVAGGGINMGTRRQQESLDTHNSQNLNGSCSVFKCLTCTCDDKFSMRGLTLLAPRVRPSRSMSRFPLQPTVVGMLRLDHAGRMQRTFVH